MSDMSPAPSSQGPSDPGSLGSQAPQMARYTLHIRVHDNQKTEQAHVLKAVRKALTTSGFNGRTVIRKAQGDWNDHDTEEMDLVMVDAPDDPQHLQAITTIAQGAKLLGGHEAVYITKQPIQTYLV